MVHIRLATLVTLLFLCFATGNAFACSCIRLETDPAKLTKSALKSSDAVFIGTVETAPIRSRKGERAIEGIQNAVFFVRKSWKGANDPTFETTGHTSGSLCGFHFDVGETYLVFVRKNLDGTFRVSSCGLTARLERAKQYAKALDDIKAQEEPK